MNIKSLLIGSAAALAAVSGAQAADAIVAAEPEPMEYVRVCDAFGTGFFYIPGTETCLKIGGYVRFQTDFGRDQFGNSDWNTWTRAHLAVEAKSDTELGTLTSVIAINGESGNGAYTYNFEDDGFEGLGSGSTSSFYIDEAYIELGGFRAGTFLNWWDNDMIGETETASNVTRFTSVRYVYDGGTFRAGLSIDEMPDYADWAGPGVGSGVDGIHNDVGFSGMVAATLGGVNFELLGAYDNAAEEGAVRAWLSAEVGPGTFELMGLYASGANAYYSKSEWSVAADYSFKATDKLSITPGAQYFGDYRLVNGNDAWRVGLTVDYQVVENLAVKATVNYTDQDVGKDEVTGFLRLQRSF
ncbi:porin [Shinella zoogloeoides]|uniref:porin n=1 Tax=Shinella zoogloeoides TaxID=352475 RepID=UPI00299D6A8C|nr:porin [Shinella zoogloeoides]WPE19483.1 Outer membrane protein IIIA [Shinella zoogloeoides]